METTTKAKIKEGYEKPSLVYVDQTTGKKLYNLETKLHETVEACAKEWLRLDERDPEKDFWKAGLPQALFDLLIGYDKSAAILAAMAYLEHEGYKVEEA
jgi:hypothetical protein